MTSMHRAQAARQRREVHVYPDTYYEKVDTRVAGHGDPLEHCAN